METLKYNPADDDPKPKTYEPYVDKKLERKKILNDFFQGNGITQPSDDDVAFKIYDFVMRGLAFGPTVESRIALLKEYEQKWVGKKISSDYGARNGMQGTVIRLSPTNPLELQKKLMYEKLDKAIKDAIPAAPFKALIKWEDGSSSLVPFSFLTTVAE